MDEIIDINTLFGPLPTAATDLSVDDLTVMMQKHGIRSCLTLSTVGMVLDHNAGNSATTAACRDAAGLVPVATVNPLSYFGGGIAARFAADGFKLVRFFPAMQGWTPDFAPFVALVKEMEADRLPVMVDIDQPGTATRSLTALGSYPGPVILGGIQATTASEAAALMRQYPNVYIETSRLVASGALKQIVEAVGADRVLYGSGAPSRPMASGIGLLRQSGLTDEQRGKVLAGNARALFKL